MTADLEPTPEQCNEKASVTFDGRTGIACWYPQMGGYGSKCVILPTSSGCFDAMVWHDGDWPFHDGQQPRRLHHCDPQQFIDFGELAESTATWVMHLHTGPGAIEIIPCKMDADGTIHFTPTAAGTITGPHRADEMP